MNTLEYVLNKYNLKNSAQIIDISNTNRESLASLFAELKFTIGAEVGVERGLYSEKLLKANPNLKLFSIDAWEVYGDYRDHMTQEEMNEIYYDAVERLKPYQCKLVKGYSVEISEQFKDESLDFVYLDANHTFEHVVADIAAWSKKVRVGGIIAGHDYIKRKGGEYDLQVPYAVNGYTDAYHIKPLFILGRKESIQGELRDRSRSWFYVKQA